MGLQLTFDRALDGARLDSLRERVRRLMSDGHWRTLEEIQAVVGGRETGVSAKLRDLRKARYGAHTVERRRIDDPSSGHWEYRVTGRAECLNTDLWWWAVGNGDAK